MEATEVTRKPISPEALSAASARLSELIKRGGLSYSTELQCRGAEPEQDNCAPRADTPAHPNGAPHAPYPTGIVGFANIIRARSAIEVASALLDELLDLMPPEPDSGHALEIADVFWEISEIAADGAQAAKRAAGKEES
jgi:hypothetical protein